LNNELLIFYCFGTPEATQKRLSFEVQFDEVIIAGAQTPEFRPVTDAVLANPDAVLLALDVATGKLAWYYQGLPGDDWDADHNQVRMLIKTRINPDTTHVKWVGKSADTIVRHASRYRGAFAHAAVTQQTRCVRSRA
jgi:glucose dehydrogenase